MIRLKNANDDYDQSSTSSKMRPIQKLSFADDSDENAVQRTNSSIQKQKVEPRHTDIGVEQLWSMTLKIICIFVQYRPKMIDAAIYFDIQEDKEARAHGVVMEGEEDSDEEVGAFFFEKWERMIAHRL